MYPCNKTKIAKINIVCIDSNVGGANNLEIISLVNFKGVRKGPIMIFSISFSLSNYLVSITLKRNVLE